MFEIKLAIPELYDVYIEDYLIQLDIYKNARVKMVVRSNNYEIPEMVDILKMYSRIALSIGEIYGLILTPGFARVIEGDKLEIQFFGYIANLFKDYGYYTQNGSGLIDYTIDDDNTGEMVGAYPVILLNDILKGTDFKVSYAPSLTDDGRVNPDNKIFIRGEWLSKAEWIYEVAKNCFFYEYVGTSTRTGNNMPDFTTDKTDNGKLIDCCNVIYDESGNIVVGVAGCQYMGYNLWKKITTNVTPYILDYDDTVYNFVKYDNAVVLGNDIHDKDVKRTFLAEPIKLEMYEIFTNDFNKENYDFLGLSRPSGDDFVWQIVDEQYNQYMECEMSRTGKKNFRVYDFAEIKDLNCQFDDKLNSFSVDIHKQTKSLPQEPNEAYKTIMNGVYFTRAGLYFCADIYDEKMEDDLHVNFQREGYFFYLEEKVSYTDNVPSVELWLRLRSSINLFPTCEGAVPDTVNPIMTSNTNIELEHTIFSYRVSGECRRCSD